MTMVQSGPQTIETRIGALDFTHDFANGFPTDETVEKLYDERDFQRGCQAYLWSLPAVCRSPTFNIFLGMRMTARTRYDVCAPLRRWHGDDLGNSYGQSRRRRQLHGVGQYRGHHKNTGDAVYENTCAAG